MITNDGIIFTGEQQLRKAKERDQNERKKHFKLTVLVHLVMSCSNRELNWFFVSINLQSCTEYLMELMSERTEILNVVRIKSIYRVGVF